MHRHVARSQTAPIEIELHVRVIREQRNGHRAVGDAAYVDSQLASVAKNVDLSKYVL